MGDLWRSEEMQLIQIFVQFEAAHATVDELGELGLIQFKDLNPHISSFQRNFVNDVKRAAEMERKIRYFESEIVKLNDEFKNIEPPIVIFEEEIPLVTKTMAELSQHLDKKEKELRELNNNQRAMNRQFNQYIEFKYVLEKEESFFFENQEEDQDGEGGMPQDDDFKVNLRFKAGVIDRDLFHQFKRILFRVTRGNLFLKSEEILDDIKDPNTGELKKKNVFIVFFQGDRLDLKIKKICEAYNAHVYRVPDTSADRKKLLGEITNSIEEQKVVISRTMNRRRAVLTQIAKKLVHWYKKVQKEKAIAHTLNKFNYDLGRRCLIGEGWCPKDATESITHALRKARERSPGAQVPSVINIIETKETPPTYFKTNKFTKAFLAIVNAYGTPRYREINPAVFTCITFPFLVGVMFGDMGHGLLLAAFGAYMISIEKKYMGKKVNEIFAMVFDGRYVIFLMGLFSIYCGLIYNECFAIPVDFFGTRWHVEEGETMFHYKNETYTYPYPVGVDPVWKGALNELLFYNSLKMKMSIILGISQMTLGIMMKLLNSIHFGHHLDIWFEFVPQICFLFSTFGYLCLLIFIKWTIASRRSPLLLLVLINMFLPGGGSANADVDPSLYNEGLERTVEQILLIIALISVPLMLIPKPILLFLNYRKKKQQQAQGIEVDDHGLEGHSLEDFKMSEIIVHQVLETIEFVLGCLSHTASYLRLWALSLAHSELATVFWDMLFAPAMAYGAFSGNPALSAIGAFLGFGAWFGCTMGIIMGMESLSAFLHALRLHWVEFQSKFYKGDGTKFNPLSYHKLPPLGSNSDD